MEPPLYKENSFESNDVSGNMGLVFERFFNGYDLGYNKIQAEGKITWLRKFNKNIGDQEVLEPFVKQQCLLTKALGGEYKVFETTYHFVSGMGYPHPVENGFAWHPILGVPYLTGSTVKGLVRAWVEDWEDDEGDKGRLLRWFGSTSKNSAETSYESQTGDIIFFDAIPAEPVKLVTDIMTPHMGQWYAEGDQINSLDSDAEKIPADWHDPIPIPFLAVEKASFLFSVAPRNTAVMERTNIDQVLESLGLALEWLGAGAKTASGYGQMVSNDKHSLIIAGKSLEEQVRIEVDSWSDHKIAENIGKKYNKIKKRKGEDWLMIAMKRLSETKADLINGWSKEPQKTLKKKAFNKLKKCHDEL
jgi:CRISPR-associated protein Cmr6